MNVKYYIDPRGSHIIFETASDSTKDVFEWIAEIQEIFEAAKLCGRCNNTVIHLRVRRVDSNVFHELLCTECGATLPMGQTRDGKRLFPKRKGAHGGWQPPYRGSEEPEYVEAR